MNFPVAGVRSPCGYAQQTEDIVVVSQFPTCSSLSSTVESKVILWFDLNVPARVDDMCGFPVDSGFIFMELCL
ncbi:hypothetical protein Hanom_Chr02g00141411 [Helianthus anomalus]